MQTEKECVCPDRRQEFHLTTACRLIEFVKKYADGSLTADDLILPEDTYEKHLTQHLTKRLHILMQKCLLSNSYELRLYIEDCYVAALDREQWRAFAEETSTSATTIDDTTLRQCVGGAASFTLAVVKGDYTGAFDSITNGSTPPTPSC